MSSVSGSFTATGQSDSIFVSRSDFTLSLSGTFVGTVALQRKIDGSNWRDVEIFTGESEMNGFEPSTAAEYRFNCSAYTSGTIAYFIETGDAI